jgi:hypothetical protein
MEKELTKLEQVEKQVEETKKVLTEKYKSKITTYIIKVDDSEIVDDYAIFYLKEAERITKLRILDTISSGGITTAGDLLVTTCLLEESDKRINTNDSLYLTLVMNVLDTIKIYDQVIKKK